MRLAILRWLAFGAVLLAALLAAPGADGFAASGPPPGAHAAAKHKAPAVPCKPARGTTTIAHSKTARLFTDAHTGYYYACLYASGHPRRLETLEHWEYRLVRFAGAYVAFNSLAEGVDADIEVLDMRTGKAHSFDEAQQVTPVKPPASECPSADRNCSVICPQVDSLVLSASGAIAWIAVDFPSASAGEGGFCGSTIEQSTEVRRFTSEGLQVIAQGNGIEPHSLSLSGSTLTWTDEGKAVSSTL